MEVERRFEKKGIVYNTAAAEMHEKIEVNCHHSDSKCRGNNLGISAMSTFLKFGKQKSSAKENGDEKHRSFNKENIDRILPKIKNYKFQIEPRSN